MAVTLQKGFRAVIRVLGLGPLVPNPGLGWVRYDALSHWTGAGDGGSSLGLDGLGSPSSSQYVQALWSPAILWLAAPPNAPLSPLCPVTPARSHHRYTMGMLQSAHSSSRVSGSASHLSRQSVVVIMQFIKFTELIVFNAFEFFGPGLDLATCPDAPTYREARVQSEIGPSL